MVQQGTSHSLLPIENLAPNLFGPPVPGGSHEPSERQNRHYLSLREKDQGKKVYTQFWSQERAEKILAN